MPVVCMNTLMAGVEVCALSRGTVVPLKSESGGFKMGTVLKVWEQLQDKHIEEMQNSYG